VKNLSVQTKVDGGEWLRGIPDVTVTSETWHRVDDGALAHNHNGKLEVTKGDDLGNYQDILALPLDPDALLAHVYKTVTVHGSREPGKAGVPMPAWERDQYAFMFIRASMWDTVLPPKLRAALYGAMAKIPDVRYEAHAETWPDGGASPFTASRAATCAMRSSSIRTPMSTSAVDRSPSRTTRRWVRT
jgi:hypothetical protein